MTALLSEMSTFCDRAGCEERLTSYGSKHAPQSLYDKALVRTYMHTLKDTGPTWMLSISNNCSIIGAIPCVVKNCMRDPTGELRPQTHVDRSLI